MRYATRERKERGGGKGVARKNEGETISRHSDFSWAENRKPPNDTTTENWNTSEQQLGVEQPKG